MRLFGKEYILITLSPHSVTVSILTTFVLCLLFGERVLIGCVTSRSNFGNISFTDIWLALKRAVVMLD
jgi:hypothetical protein